MKYASTNFARAVIALLLLLLLGGCGGSESGFVVTDTAPAPPAPPAVPSAVIPVGNQQGIQVKPEVAALSDGNFLVVWMQTLDRQNLVATELRAQRFSASGTPVGEVFDITSGAVGEELFPVVAGGPAGSFVVTWFRNFQVPGLREVVFARRYDGQDQPLGPAFQVSPGVDQLESLSDVCVAPDGSFFITWGVYDTDPTSVWARGYNPDGAAMGEAFQVSTSQDTAIGDPAIACDGSGNFTIVWEAGGSFERRIVGRQYNAEGVAVGQQLAISPAGSAVRLSPDLAMAADGSFVVVYELAQESPLPNLVMSRAFDSAATPLGGERPLTPDTQFSAAPAIAMAPDGSFVASWEVVDVVSFSGSEVFLQRFHEDVTPAGPITRLTAGSSSLYEFNQRLAIDANGTLAATWCRSEDDVPTTVDVFLQIFPPGTPE